MVDNLRAEGGDNAETERTLAERLHKLTTLENKEVMSDSKIDQLANLVKEKGESFEGRSFSRRRMGVVFQFWI